MSHTQTAGETAALGTEGEDASLVAAARRGDHAAYAALVDRYTPLLMYITQRLLRDRTQAEDACQEAFLRAYTHLDDYNPAYRFGTWLGAIATHHCLRLLARQDLQHAGVDAAQLAGALLEEGPEPHVMRQEQAESLRRIVSRLPSRYQRALVLRHWHDLSYEEIAVATGQSLGAVKTQLHRARAMLAEALRATGHAHALH